MNTEKVEGKFDQVAGKIKQSVGEAVGNQKLANSGAVDQIKGVAKETWGNAKDTAAVVRDDNAARTAAERDDLKYRAETSAHNLREKIVDSAHNLKETVNEKLDDIKRDHRG
ncbi:MAG: CsbD family protein [Edaphobacter sp.]